MNDGAKTEPEKHTYARKQAYTQHRGEETNRQTDREIRSPAARALFSRSGFAGYFFTSVCPFQSPVRPRSSSICLPICVRGHISRPLFNFVRRISSRPSPSNRRAHRVARLPIYSIRESDSARHKSEEFLLFARFLVTPQRTSPGAVKAETAVAHSYETKLTSRRLDRSAPPCRARTPWPASLWGYCNGVIGIYG